MHNGQSMFLIKSYNDDVIYNIFKVAMQEKSIIKLLFIAAVYNSTIISWSIV